ncbi:MAG: polysaccharide deacetylase family protein [Caulobacteraceae bacterium]|nr:polysaccharide deacetylase family protein [Caulobacter sp.]
MTPAPSAYEIDRSLGAKLRRRLVRLRRRAPAPAGPDRPWATFSFDDAPASVLGAGLPILEAHGLRATIYACPGLAGGVTSLGRLMDAGELRRAAAGGHEIGCHTNSHRDLARASSAETRAELDASAAGFAAAGLPPPATFAYPYGETDVASKAVCASRFSLCRGIHAGRVTRGSDLAQAPAIHADGPDGEARALAGLRAAAARGGWVILFMHRVSPLAGEFSIHPDALARLVAATRELGIEPVTAAEGVRRLRA